MPKRIKLDTEYIARIRKETQPLDDQVKGLEVKKIPCPFCSFRTINKFPDLKEGHFSAVCPRCGQVAIYNAADYRHYPGTRPNGVRLPR